MKQLLTTNWHVFRIIRVVAGILFTIQAIRTHDAVLGFAGIAFAIMAVFNTSCCGAIGNSHCSSNNCTHKHSSPNNNPKAS